MVLCQKAKLDQKNRILIPRDFIKVAGGEDNGSCYVTCDEDTKEIKIIIRPMKEKENQG